MKLAVPSDTDAGMLGMRSGHFGHCAYFTIVTIEDGETKGVEIVKNVDHDAVGCGGVIEFAMSLGIDAILAGGMGRPPFMRFTQGGIGVYIDRVHPLVGDAVKAFINGETPQMVLDDACVH